MTTIEEARRIVDLADKVATLDTKIDERQLSLKILQEDRRNAQAQLQKFLDASTFKVGDTVMIEGSAAKFVIFELNRDKARLRGAQSDIGYGWYYTDLLRKA